MTEEKRKTMSEEAQEYLRDYEKIEQLVEEFSASILMKLSKKLIDGKSGWDDPAWTIGEVKDSLLSQVTKGDPIDCAAYAAFWWHKEKRNGKRA